MRSWFILCSTLSVFIVLFSICFGLFYCIGWFSHFGCVFVYVLTVLLSKNFNKILRRDIFQFQVINEALCHKSTSQKKQVKWLLTTWQPLRLFSLMAFNRSIIAMMKDSDVFTIDDAISFSSFIKVPSLKVVPVTSSCFCTSHTMFVCLSIPAFFSHRCI